MNAAISVICYKSKTLSNGEHPLMLRVIKNRKISYKSLKVSVNAKFWDFDKNEPKGKFIHPYFATKCQNIVSWQNKKRTTLLITLSYGFGFMSSNLLCALFGVFCCPRSFIKAWVWSRRW